MAQKNQQKGQKGQRVQSYSTERMVILLSIGVLLAALGILIFLANALGLTGDVFDGLRALSGGLCGALGIVLAVIPVWGGVLMVISTQRQPPLRAFLLGCLMLVLLCTAATLLSYTSDGLHLLAAFQARLAAGRQPDSLPGYLSNAYNFGSAYNAGGGLLGMLLAWPLWQGLGAIGGAIVAILVLIVVFLFLIRLDVRGLLARSRGRREERHARLQQEQQQFNQQQLAWQQEQARIHQEQQRQRQEQMRQQQAAWQQANAQPVQPAYDPSMPPAAPIVRQVQTGRRAQPAPTMGFQPTPEELGMTPDPMHTTAPQPAAEEAPRRKRGGVFNRSQEADPKAVPRRKGLFSRDTAPQQPVLDEPEELYTPEPEIFTPAPDFRTTAAMHQAPNPAVRQATGPTAPLRQATGPVQPVMTRQTGPMPPVAPAAQAAPAAEPAAEQAANPNSFLARLRAARKAEGLEVPEETPAPAESTTPPRPKARTAAPDRSWEDTPPWEDSPDAADPAAPLRPVVTQHKPEGGYEPELNLKPRRSGSDMSSGPIIERAVETPYVYPTMNLLKNPVPQQGVSPEEDAYRAGQLEDTLQSFNIPAKVQQVTHGPVISRFELSIAAGIKVSKVVDLERNIAMTMEAQSVRIEAPIPGKPLVGVEIPNRQRGLVTLREVLESAEMRGSTKPLEVALGRDIAGTPIVCDLSKMPHLLIAGATGSGKSVCINTIICSLLYRCSPKDVRLIMIDPKVVELQCYNSMPHLLIPVVSDPHKASGALAWAVGEMMNRYNIFKDLNVRNIDGYNEQLPAGEEKMPRIVIIIDELADLMMTCKRDVEERINRLTQLARAAGIHLIVATQRPSVDVITGLIKANIPARIAFKVTSNADSRTILGYGGAEHLLGLGDMLYAPPGAFGPTRVQGCFLSDGEVNRITDFIREHCPVEYDQTVLEELERLQSESGDEYTVEMPTGDENPASDANLLTQCIEMAVNDRQVSTSLIQRRLRLGYARAGRLVDEMEKRGIVGPKDGARPRMCLISREEFEAMKATGELE